MLVRRPPPPRLSVLVGGGPRVDIRRKRPPLPDGLSPRVKDRVLCSIPGRGPVGVGAGAGSESGVPGGVVPAVGQNKAIRQRKERRYSPGWYSLIEHQFRLGNSFLLFRGL